METVDEEVTAAALDFMNRAKRAGKPFFLWWNSTRMHVFTHLKKESVGKTGLGIYADGMVEHDAMVGSVARRVEEARPRRQHDRHVFHRQRLGGLLLARRRHHNVPRRESTRTGRAATASRRSSAGPASSSRARSSTRSVAHEDMLPTLLAAVGDADVKEKLLKGGVQAIGRKTYKVHLDGYNLLPALKGQGEWPRKEFILLDRRRQRRWRCVTAIGRSPSCGRTLDGLHVWQEPFVALRAPMLTNLRMDPFELARDIGMDYDALDRGTHVPDRCPRLPTSGSGCRASGSSRHARSPAASTSTA